MMDDCLTKTLNKVKAYVSQAVIYDGYRPPNNIIIYLIQFPALKKLGMMAHTSNLSALEVEIEGSGVLCHSWLH